LMAGRNDLLACRAEKSDKIDAIAWEGKQ